MVASERLRRNVRRIACDLGVPMARLARRLYGAPDGAAYLRILRRMSGQSRFSIDEVEGLAEELGVDPRDLLFSEPT